MDQAHPVDPRTYEAAVAWRHWVIRHQGELGIDFTLSYISAVHRVIEMMADELGWPY